MIAYSGAYSLEGNKVTRKIEVSWNQAWTGTNQQRFVEDKNTTDKEEGCDSGSITTTDGGRRCLRAETAARRAQALPAGAHAGAAVPLQSRVRRLRQDRLSGRHFEQAPVGEGMSRRGRRVRRP